MVTGKFDFDSMVMAAPLLGPVVFFVFVLVATIVLVNIFLTLIISAFETVKHDVMKQDNEYEIVDFMKKKLRSLVGLYDFSQETREVVDQKEQKLKLLEEQIAFLPTKVDYFLNFVNKVHFKGQLNIKSDYKNKSTFDEFVAEKLNDRAADAQSVGTTGRSNGRRNRRRSSVRNEETRAPVPKVAFLNWNEVEEWCSLASPN